MNPAKSPFQASPEISFISVSAIVQSRATTKISQRQWPISFSITPSISVALKKRKTETNWSWATFILSSFRDRVQQHNSSSTWTSKYKSHAQG